MGQGDISFCCGLGIVHSGFALRMVSSVPSRRTLWVQHNDAKDLVAGPVEGDPPGFVTGAALIDADSENRRMDRTILVAMGVGHNDGFSNADARPGAGSNPATFQQIYSTNRRQFA